MSAHPLDEVVAAFRAIVAAGDDGDWGRWSDLHIPVNLPEPH
jgi:hypothetical protein